MLSSRYPTACARILFILLLSCTAYPLSAQISSQTEVTFADDFQAGFGDWFADNGVWQVGIPTAGPDSSSSSGMVAGTVLGGMYPQTARSRLVSPPIALPDSADLAGSNLRLSFNHWYSFNSQDEGRLQISIDGGSWSDFPGLTPFMGSNGSWTTSSGHDLTAYAGKEINIGFLFSSSDPLVDVGWYIDDVNIFVEAARVFSGFEDFTFPVLDWEIEGSAWDFGTTADSEQPDHAQNGVAATVLNGAYPSANNHRLISPEIVLSDSIELFLTMRFDHRFDFAPGDTGFVQVSVDGGDWQTVGQGFYGLSGPWSRYIETDFSDFVSTGDRVRFAFQLAAQSGTANHDGWQIDNVAITVDQPGIYGPFGSGENVTIGPEDPGSPAGFGWYSDNGLWEVGLPTSGPGAAQSDSVVAATGLTGPYHNGAFSRFVSPPLQITDLPFGISFWHWFDFSPGDQGIVQISINYGDWIDLADEPFTNSSGVWTLFRIRDVVRAMKEPVDESAITDGSIRIGFLFTSQQSGGTSAGWYLDDIKLEGLVYTSNEAYEQPRAAILDQNYPNPFNPSTTIGFTIEASERVTLKIYDLLGREVAALLDGEFLTAGAHSYTWHAGRQASGVYLYKLETEASTMIRRMHLVK